jgi:acyl-CoA thioester hydrolase
MKRKNYFQQEPNSPSPIKTTISRRLRFSETDALAIAWHGRFPQFFEEAQTELGHKCGLTYDAFRDEGITAPVAQIHIDYFRPLLLDKIFTVKASLLWNDAARLNTEYRITDADGLCACTGYTIQLFVDIKTREPLWLSPNALILCRQRWLAGEFYEK